MRFTYRTPWIHWPVVAILWFAGIALALRLGVSLLFALEIEHDNKTAIRIVGWVAEGSAAALIAFLTAKLVRLADRFHTNRPIILTDDDFMFFSVNGLERRVRWADVKSLTDDFRSGAIIIFFKRQMVSDIYHRRRSDEWVRFSKDRIAPSGDDFFAQAQRLMDSATASLPKDRHAEYLYCVR